MNKLCLVIFVCVLFGVNTQNRVGHRCLDEYTNTVGICQPAYACQSARQNLEQNGIQPTFCQYTYNSVLVCCRDGVNIFQTPKPNNRPENRPVWGNDDANIANKFTTGGKRVSERKCIEYSSSVTTSVDFFPLLPDPETMSILTSKCKYTVSELIVGGKDAQLGEFPHMAAIGWLTFDGDYAFKCAGSLISPNFVLTAAHCNKIKGYVRPSPDIVRLGVTNIVNGNINNPPNDVPIKAVHPHPNYHSPSKYDDIALLELTTSLQFSDNIRPACLWPGGNFGIDKAIATGWGVTDTQRRKTSDTLKLVPLTLLNNNYCQQLLERQHLHDRNWNGFVPSQLCAGEINQKKDTCQGDSGGPLQLVSRDNPCIFYIIGITSFGFQCAKNVPAVYTRVSSYIDWIEEKVWPGE